ncbi:MAG: DUF1398 domain-containing protein [Planctomycetaceae bacterium]|nr:DUF1398 domain-containing protein [Planctomycetaceae bacterium]
MDAIAVVTECNELSLQGKITFPEVVRRLSEVGVERYHVDLTRDETTYYLAGGESHVLALHGPKGEIVGPFDAGGVEQAVRASQRGEITHPEFLARIRAAGCVGYLAQLAGRRVQYVGRTGDMHVEPFPSKA